MGDFGAYMAMQNDQLLQGRARLQDQAVELNKLLNNAHYLMVCGRDIIRRFEGDLDGYEQGILEEMEDFVRKTD